MQRKEGLVLLEVEGTVARITINRPEAANAFSPVLIKEFMQVLSELKEQQSLRVLTITGQGNKAFCAGADIDSMADMTVDQGRQFMQAGQQLMNAVESLPFITIAALNGFALGGGTELALSCDLRVAAENAKLGLPEVKIGLIPGWGGTQRLARLIGKGKALEYIVTGDMISANDARHMGLVNNVVPGVDLAEACRQLEAKIAGNSPVAVKQAKKAVARGIEMALSEGIAFELEASTVNFAHPDRKEGLRAFLEKRAPKFSG